MPSSISASRWSGTRRSFPHGLSEQISTFASASSPHAWQTQRHQFWHARQLGFHPKNNLRNGAADKIAVFRATIDDPSSFCNNSQREGLSVGQSSSSMSERTVRSGRPSGQELNVANAQRQKSKFSPNARRRLRNTNSRLIMTKEVYENKVKLLILSKKNFTALKLKNFNDEIKNFVMNAYCSKIRNYVKLIIKVSMKWKN